MEPWDGPALIAFTDGTVIGAVLDRNGLRPGRYWVTRDGLVVLASEVGVLDIDPGAVVRKGRLQPGRIFLADTVAGRIVEDEEVKASLAAEHPYEAWLHAGLVHLDDLPERWLPPGENTDLITSQRMHGYTEEELRVILTPMARSGAEPVGSMGTDTPLAVLSSRPRLRLRLLQPAVRPGDEPAAGRDQGRARHLASHHHRSRAEPAGTESGLLPPDRAALPGDRRPGPGQAGAHQRGGQPARAGLARGRRPLRPARRRRRPAGPAGRDLRRGLRRHRGPAPASSSSPTAPGATTPHPSRSRRCC